MSLSTFAGMWFGAGIWVCGFAIAAMVFPSFETNKWWDFAQAAFAVFAIIIGIVTFIGGAMWAAGLK